MNPICEKIEPMLGAYADGELAPNDRHPVQAHLVDCAECRTRLAAFQHIDRLYVTMTCAQPTEGRWRQMIWNVIPRAEVPPFPQRELSAGTQRIPMSITPARPVRWAAYAASALALAGVILVAVFVFFPASSLPIVLMPLAADNTCSLIEIDTTASGYQASLQLPADDNDLLVIDIINAPNEEL